MRQGDRITPKHTGAAPQRRRSYVWALAVCTVAGVGYGLWPAKSHTPAPNEQTQKPVRSVVEAERPSGPRISSRSVLAAVERAQAKQDEAGPSNAAAQERSEVTKYAGLSFADAVEARRWDRLSDHWERSGSYSDGEAELLETLTQGFEARSVPGEVVGVECRETLCKGTFQLERGELLPLLEAVISETGLENAAVSEVNERGVQFTYFLARPGFALKTVTEKPIR